MSDTRNKKRDAVSIEIVKRFYEGFYALRENKAISNASDFCKIIGVDRGAFYKQKIDLEARILDVSWLVPIVEAGISAKWLLTGKGNMMK